MPAICASRGSKLCQDTAYGKAQPAMKLGHKNLHGGVDMDQADRGLITVETEAEILS